MKKLLSTLLFIVASLPTMAQIDDLNNGINSIDPNGNITNSQNAKTQPTRWDRTRKYRKASMYGKWTGASATASWLSLTPSPICS